jgi:hypothetical protein
LVISLGQGIKQFSEKNIPIVAVLFATKLGGSLNIIKYPPSPIFRLKVTHAKIGGVCCTAVVVDFAHKMFGSQPVGGQ